MAALACEAPFATDTRVRARPAQLGRQAQTGAQARGAAYTRPTSAPESSASGTACSASRAGGPRTSVEPTRLSVMVAGRAFETGAWRRPERRCGGGPCCGGRATKGRDLAPLGPRRSAGPGAVPELEPEGKWFIRVGQESQAEERLSLLPTLGHWRQEPSTSPSRLSAVPLSWLDSVAARLCFPSPKVVGGLR